MWNKFRIIFTFIKPLIKQNIFIIKEALKAKDINKAINSYYVIKKEYPEICVGFDAANHKWCIASYNADTEKIMINVISKFWENKEKFLKEQVKNFFSSNNDHHIFYHEIGHYLHRKKIGQAKMILMGNQDYVNDYNKKSLINTEVSYHATFNQIEFVAETFAGMKAGKVYPDEIMKEYKSLDGPE